MDHCGVGGETVHEFTALHAVVEGTGRKKGGRRRYKPILVFLHAVVEGRRRYGAVLIGYLEVFNRVFRGVNRLFRGNETNNNNIRC